MNKERIEQAIAIMKRAGVVLMSYFHSKNAHDPALCQTMNVARTEEELHQCGAAACFAGWVAVSPEFAAAGGWPSMGGSPNLADLDGAEAIAEWLGISWELANGLVYNDPQPGELGSFYGKGLEDVTREDVISKLEELLAQCEG